MDMVILFLGIFMRRQKKKTENAEEQIGMLDKLLRCCLCERWKKQILRMWRWNVVHVVLLRLVEGRLKKWEQRTQCDKLQIIK